VLRARRLTPMARRAPARWWGSRPGAMRSPTRRSTRRLRWSRRADARGGGRTAAGGRRPRWGGEGRAGASALRVLDGMPLGERTQSSVDVCVWSLVGSRLYCDVRRSLKAQGL
jgi:hypothetical protein